MSRVETNRTTRRAVGLSTMAALVSLTAFARNDAGSATLSRADPDMQRVLDAFAELQPVPLVVLTPQEGRAQPSLTDAQQRVLLDQGRDTTSSSFVPGVTTFERAVPGAAGPLPATVYVPGSGGDGARLLGLGGRRRADPRGRELVEHDRVDELEVMTRSDLRDDAAEDRVRARLRRDQVRPDGAAVDNGGAGVVAGRLDRQDHGIGAALRHMITASSPLSA